MGQIFVSFVAIVGLSYFVKSVDPLSVRYSIGFSLFILFSSHCSVYLYRNSIKNKVAWALFGFCTNMSAVLIHWFYYDIISKWKKRESIFSDNPYLDSQK